MSTGTPVIAVQNMPPEYLEKFNESRAYIVNITDTDYMLSRTYGNYPIRAKQLGEFFSVTEIGPRKGTMDMGDRRVFEFPITPADVAKDLCREINNEAGLNSFLGVFVAAGPVPTAKELADANRKLERFYQWGVNEGDKIWQQTRMVILIPDWIKRAADYLHLDREWKTNVQPKAECPNCGTHIKSGIATCPICLYVVDREKAARLGMIPPSSPEPAPVADPPGESTANLAAPARKGKKKS
jgi:hypothetical protein